MKLLELPGEVSRQRQHSLFDDFYWYISPHVWTSVISDAGSAAGGDGAGGILTIIPSDGTVGDNDETYVATTNNVFKMADDKPIVCEAKVQFAEANTNAANVFFGMADAIGANTLVDNGAGLKTSFSGFAIYKVDGGTVWKCVSSKGATQTISTSTTTAGGSSYQKLRIEFRPITSTTGEITFYVDDVPLYDSAITGRNYPIKHQITFTSAVAMMLGCGVKNGSTSLETLLVDYMAGWSLR